MDPQAAEQSGVTVVVCCHNSAQRLPQTLAALAVQQLADARPWEVLVVDNASTDNTREVARQCWSSDAPAPLRCVEERELGVGPAREAGFGAARYPYVSFVDDDNWPEPDWVERVAQTLDRHPEVGAVGGLNSVAHETPLPAWFETFQGCYAIGPQGAPGDVTDSRGFLWGAGLSVRRAAWAALRAEGTAPLVQGRRGDRLLSGEDSELCIHLTRRGWRLYYEPTLRLQHFMPAERLCWSYLCRLRRGFGAQNACLETFASVISHGTAARDWRRGAYYTARGLLQAWRKLLPAMRYAQPGDPGILRVWGLIGRLDVYLGMRGNYDRLRLKAGCESRADPVFPAVAGLRGVSRANPGPMIDP
ncbi:MAG: glycosyltransferase family 2 protein [Chromatiales bacterium]|nr:glycosyltransferase family 2 protein [Chromatiales bacterium]